MTHRRQLNRDRVITEAARLADEGAVTRGDPSAVSLSALAQALHVKPPSLYNHVSSLDDLQDGMAALAARRLLAELRQAAQGRVGREAITAMAHAYHRFAKRHPGTYPLTIRAPRPDQPQLAEPAQELLQLLLFALASMGLQGDDALHAVRGLRALLHGFVSLESAGGFAMALDLEESFRRLVEGYLRDLPGF
jgi:AcrR family transcriptional regulator